jgi:hypothetical protein
MKPLKFIHITKCAGSTIEDLGLKNGYIWGRHHRTEYGFWHDLFPKKNIKLKNKYDWFMVVRNPYERLVSEFYCRWGGLGQQKEINLNQQQFNNYIENKILEPNKKAHYLEQHKYIDPEQTIHIIRYENIENEFNKLMDKYSIKIKWDPNMKYNKPLHFKKFSVKSFSPRVINLINKIYDKDFSIFGYKKICV